MKPKALFRLFALLSCCPILLGSWPTQAQTTTNWAFGPKSILCIRICYPDDFTEPIREAEAYALMESASRFYVENSYGVTWLTNVTVTPVVLMPHPKSYYSHGFSVTEVWDVAAQAGYYRTNYDIDCIFSVGVGLGNTSTSRTIYICAPGVRTICHELGHIYGLPHSDGWFARGSSIIGPGRGVGYGNPFDTMGTGYGHFNTCFKGHLEWLAQSYIQDVTASGLFRLYAYDGPRLTNGLKYALRILRSEQLPQFQRYYWLELPQQVTNNASTQNGPLLFCGPDGTPQMNQEVVLLDATPNYTVNYSTTVDGFKDAALRPCHTFSETALGIHITSMPTNGTVPGSVDIRVNLGFFTNNHPPTVSITSTATNVAAREAVSFVASASDQDSDELVYAWDFGDGGSSAGQSSVTHSWPRDGEYVVRCEVSDMKGGTASAAALVRVENPATFTISGHLQDAGQPLDGVRVSISPTRSTLTSSDGSYTLTGLANGHCSLLPSKAYYQFSPISQSVAVSNQSLSGLDFVGTATAVPNNAPLVQLKSPSDGWTLLAGTSLDLFADCYADGPITNLVFYEGTNLLGAGLNGITWTNVPTGQYLLRAVATDDLGLSASSAELGIIAVTGPPANDDFANRIPLTGPVVSAVGHNVGATAEPGEPGHGNCAASQSVWYSWVAPSNGLFAVSAENSPVIGATAAVHVGESLADLGPQLVYSRKGEMPSPGVFHAEQGVAYQIALEGGTPGTVAFNIRPAHPPANDNFAGRITLSGVPVTATGSTLDASLELGDPIALWEGIGSVWWSWTAPDSGTFYISTEASGFVVSLAVYTGNDLGSLALATTKGYTEQSFKALGGTTYQIEAYGLTGAGDFSHSIRRANPPPNDDFVNRIALSGGVAVAYGSNSEATREPDEPWIIWHNYGGASIWWSWQAPFDGRFVVTADGTGVALLGIYTGSTLSNLTLVASQYLDTRLSIQAAAGTTYQIAADRAGSYPNPWIRLRIFPESSTFESVSLLPSAPMQLSLAGEPSRPYVLEASGDFRNWLPVMTNWSYSGSVQFINSDPGSFERRFYRGVSQ